MIATHFMVRVELRGWASAESGADRDALAAALAAEGFSRLMTGPNGEVYALPDGEFHIAGEYTGRDVMARAKRAAAGRRCTILITEAVAFLASGLDPADGSEDATYPGY